MSKYNWYTALIGIISVFFVLAVFFGGLPVIVKVLLTILGAGIFFHSAILLYRELRAQDFSEMKNFFDKPKVIDKIILLSYEEC